MMLLFTLISITFLYQQTPILQPKTSFLNCILIPISQQKYLHVAQINSLSPKWRDFPQHLAPVFLISMKTAHATETV
jgi:hypothetical protein